MQYIGYDELNLGRNFPSIKVALEKESYPHKKDIVNFLRNGEIDIARASRKKDVFDGELIPDEILVMHDGDYYWSNELAWYVNKYNLRLPKEFESHILSKIDE